MSVIAVLAPGPSMSQELADKVKGKCPAIAVANAYSLAPWACALVANDAAWWRVYPEALNFAGRKFCGVNHPGTERLPPTTELGYAVNSGCQGVRVARDMYGAKRILLLGFDMSARKGHHFFGKHPASLRNTTDARFHEFIKQFDRLNITGISVINCTERSALRRFPFGDIDAELAKLSMADVA